MFVYCDSRQLTKQFTVLADYENYENYIVYFSRGLGTWINTWGELTTCMDEGSAKGNGFDVGYCGSTLLSKLFDT